MSREDLREKYEPKYKRLTVVLDEGKDLYLDRLAKDLKVSKQAIMATIIDKSLADIYGALEYGEPEHNAVLMSLEYMKSIKD